MNGRKICCSYCGLHNHQSFKMLEENDSIQETIQEKATCTEDVKDFQTLPEKGTSLAQCWTLHPTTHPKQLKQVEKIIDKNRIGDSIIDASQDDSQEEDV